MHHIQIFLVLKHLSCNQTTLLQVLFLQPRLEFCLIYTLLFLLLHPKMFSQCKNHKSALLLFQLFFYSDVQPFHFVVGYDKPFSKNYPSVFTPISYLITCIFYPIVTSYLRNFKIMKCFNSIYKIPLKSKCFIFIC